MKAMSTAVQRLFAKVSPTYDLINRILTFGLDRGWRERAAASAADRSGIWIDVCCGTGDMVADLAHLATDETKVLGLDFSWPMLRKARKKPGMDRTILLLADARILPVLDGSVDVITVSFGVRNIRHSHLTLAQTFKEFHRVLKPGGLFVSLETSQPQSKIVRWLFHTYACLFVRGVGGRISGSRSGYAYLSSTASQFYNAAELSETIREAGFHDVRYHHMMFGVVAIHEAST